jgi:hypothetical protein
LIRIKFCSFRFFSLFSLAFANKIISNKKQADENKVEAIKDENDAEHLVNESNKEKDEMDVLESKIASEESLYETEFNKASSEGSEASSNTLNLESDGMATSMCEFVTFVDVLCDFVGSVAVAWKLMMLSQRSN